MLVNLSTAEQLQKISLRLISVKNELFRDELNSAQPQSFVKLSSLTDPHDVDHVLAADGAVVLVVGSAAGGDGGGAGAAAADCLEREQLTQVGAKKYRSISLHFD